MSTLAPRPKPRTKIRVVAAAMRATSTVAKRLGRGGSVLGGHVGYALDRQIITHLAADRWIVALSATNGKTTMTSLVTSALSTTGPVVSNASGSNLRTGVAAALAGDLTTPRAALEVDEATLAVIGAELQPDVIVLGNLSRDQLDRYGEVRILAERWRTMFDQFATSGHTGFEVVANANDPLVVWSASEVPHVTWVSIPMAWTADSSICPKCGQTIEHSRNGWACTGCDLARPCPDVELHDGVIMWHTPNGDESATVELSLPGEFNLANAALAAVAARLGGIEPQPALEAMANTTEVAGRYRTVVVGKHHLRLLMAKNPAGWHESLRILQPTPTPVVVGINARIADGRDPSWLWDVSFEALRGRPVIATGDRAHDLSVRLHYAGVDHDVQPGKALGALEALAPGPVDVVCNYTAFADILAALP